VRRLCRKCAVLAAAAVLAAFGLWQAGGGAWIYAKAALAKSLIADAWAETLASGVQIRPWPWADTWPVARLRFPRQKEDAVVLAGANGAMLAFGPGHLDGTPAPGDEGNSVIAGHRDTSFTVLGELTLGDPVSLQTDDGAWLNYRVTGSALVDSRIPWTPPDPAPGGSMLTLVTCWPFDAIAAGGPLRYLVFVEETLATAETP
jgi:sortase A